MQIAHDEEAELEEVNQTKTRRKTRSLVRVTYMLNHATVESGNGKEHKSV